MKRTSELPECPVAATVALIGGKWKLLILRNLEVRPWRFNELQNNLDGISHKVLTATLRQMVQDGIVWRHDYQLLPQKVEYGLTALGQEMRPILDSLANFGRYYQSIVKRAEQSPPN
ncbi:MAG: winged helix-turn-helix transcriptional regulator [Kiritimatiellia bacterium]